MGTSAEPSLREALAGQPSLEARRRIERLLDRLGTPSALLPEEARSLRAVEVLEYVGSPAAREVLGRLARGAPHARLTQEARASLKRLSGRTR
jgi:hypothetical protein